MKKQHNIVFTNHTNVGVVITNATAQKFILGENDTLRGKRIKSIDTFKVADVSMTPLGNAVVNAVVFAKAFLVLSISGEERINRIPLSALCPTVNNGKRFTFPEPGVVIDFAKSYVEVPSVAGLVLNEAFLFNFFYDHTTN